jgi:hypothetical protein
MKALIVGIAVIAFAGVATAETIVDACERVAALEFGVDTVTSSDVHAFPELSPPRVRMRVAYSRTVESDPIAKVLGGEAGEVTTDAGQVMCRFDRAKKPFGLAHFECAGMACSISPERLEELQALMARDGY